MDNKLFTLLEVAIIGGLIIFVLYLGGLFTPAPKTPTPNPYVTVEPTLDVKAPTRTPRPTRAPRLR